MKKLLTLKHWQIFVLMIGLPFVVYIGIIVGMLATQDARIMAVGGSALMAYSMVMHFSYHYHLGAMLNEKLPIGVRMNLKLFTVFLLVPTVYIASIAFFIFHIFNHLGDGPFFNPLILFIIVPLHFFSIFCIFYCLYFNSKSLKSVELQKQTGFTDYAGEFFMMWFFPIGVWFIQPRVNALAEEKSMPNNYQP